MQYLDTGWIAVAVTLLVVGFILFNIYRASNAKEGRGVYIRRIPGLNALDDAIGRATEMGRPILMVPGIGELNAISVQAINVFAHVTKSAAQFSTPIRLCCANAAVYTVAQEIIRDVYQSQGMSEKYDSSSVQFLSDRQFAFAAGVSGMILREKAAAAFLLGEFFAESLIFAETCNSVGAIQVAGSTQNTQTPFFIAACDYVLIGEEFYAASAYLRREPVLTGSLAGQDWGKLFMMGLIVVGIGLNSYDRNQKVDFVRSPVPIEVEGKTIEGAEELKEYVVDAEHPARFKNKSETTMNRILTPLISAKDITIVRELTPEAKEAKEKAAAEAAAAAAGGGN